MYKILKFDNNSVYLTQEGKIKKLARELFDFDINLGDRVDVFQDGEIVLVLPHKEEAVLDFASENSVKSSLLQGILDLFLETLSIHNNDLGNLKKIFSQLLVTLFMAWSLVGVILIEILLFLESALVFIWKLLLKGLRALHLIDNGKKLVAYRKEKEVQRKQDQLEEELRLAQETDKQVEAQPLPEKTEEESVEERPTEEKVTADGENHTGDNN